MYTGSWKGMSVPFSNAKRPRGVVPAQTSARRSLNIQKNVIIDQRSCRKRDLRVRRSDKRFMSLVIGIRFKLPVALSEAETFKIPLALMSKVTSMWGTPRGAGRVPKSQAEQATAQLLETSTGKDGQEIDTLIEGVNLDGGLRGRGQCALGTLASRP
jgi:hypothetical protein